MGNRVLAAVGVVLFLVAGACGFYLVTQMGLRNHDEAVVEGFRDGAAADSSVPTVPSAVDGWMPDIDANLLRRIDFDEVLSVAPDATRWMYVPDTALDSPVMQEREVGVWHYDRRDMYGDDNEGGSFLTPALREGETDGHLVILGHHMDAWQGEWQFSTLEPRWGSLEGAEEYPFVYVYYPDHSERWRVWAGIDASADDVIYDLGWPLGSDEYEGMLAHVAEASRYQTEERPSRWCNTLMMSTCHTLDSGEHGRFALFSVPDLRYDYETHMVTDMVEKGDAEAWRRERDAVVADAERLIGNGDANREGGGMA